MRITSFIVIKLVFIFALFIGSAGDGFSEEFPQYSDDSVEMEKNINAIATNKKVKAMIDELASAKSGDDRFDLTLELSRIGSPSREELYRAKSVSKIFSSYIDKYSKAGSITAKNARVVYDFAGKLAGAGVQMVDNMPVYNVCMEIKGTYTGTGYKGIRPKVLFEGHLDSVNPAHLDGYPKIRDTTMQVHVQNVNEKVVNSKDALSKLTALKFTKDGKIDKTDPNYQLAKKRYVSASDAKNENGLRVYVPSIADMMLRSAAVIQTAEYILKHDIRPVYDLWICGTAGEEGRGNLAGVKQLFGYSQDGIVQPDGSIKYRGMANNALNFVANISAESGGGGIAIHYLGSHRYEVAYRSVGGDRSKYGKQPTSTGAAARAVSCISKLKTPAEDKSIQTKYSDLTGNSTPTSYTVGVVYANTSKPFAIGKIASDVSVEVDMRSNNPINVEIMDRQIQACFQHGIDAENNSFNIKPTAANAVKREILWYGDRPAYTLSAEQMRTSKMLQAISYAHKFAFNERMVLDSPTKKSSSVNSNVPAKITIPTVNLDYGVRADYGQGHGYNEWIVLGDAKKESLLMSRAIYTLLAITGFAEEGISPAYPPIGARQTDVIFP